MHEDCLGGVVLLCFLILPGEFLCWSLMSSSFPALFGLFRAFFKSDIQAHSPWACVSWGGGLCSKVAELFFALLCYLLSPLEW